MSEDKRVKKLSTKKKFVADGVFNAELNALLQKVLSQEGYSGISVRATSMCTEIRIVAAKHDELMEKGARRVREIKSIIEKRYNFNDEDNKVEITIKPPDFDKALCSAANVEALKFKLLTGTPVRNAVNNIMGGIMRRNAIGCTIMIGGKVRGQRAKAQKYSMGYLISTGQPMKEFVDVSIRHVHMRQGVLGLKVKIMASLEKKVGKTTIVMPDFIKINEPKDDDVTAIVPGVQFQRQQNAAAMPDAPQ
jgi:small subunit ribosomal protein S3e